MPGLIVMPINRVPVSTLTLVTGTIVSGYPLNNLKSPRKDLETRITPATGSVIIKIVLPATPSSTGDVDYNIRSLFLSGNFDNATIKLWRHTADVLGSATSVANLTLDNYCDNPDMLLTFSGVSYRYWWLEVTTGVSPLIINAFNLGDHIDLGYPDRPRGISFVEQDSGVRLLGGYVYPGRLGSPIIRREYRFQDPNYMTAAAIYDNTKAFGTNYRAANTLQSAFEQPYQFSLASGATRTRTGLMTPGGSVPIPFREPDSVGYSTAGRPAFYGYPTLTLSQDIYRTNTLAAISFEEVLPRGANIKPGTA